MVQYSLVMMNWSRGLNLPFYIPGECCPIYSATSYFSLQNRLVIQAASHFLSHFPQRASVQITLFQAKKKFPTFIFFSNKQNSCFLASLTSNDEQQQSFSNQGPDSGNHYCIQKCTRVVLGLKLVVKGGICNCLDQGGLITRVLAASMNDNTTFRALLFLVSSHNDNGPALRSHHDHFINCVLLIYFQDTYRKKII